jgi:hypothetical protein
LVGDSSLRFHNAKITLQRGRELVLFARVGRCVEGLDVALYVEALDVMRKHLHMFPYGDV